ncbi:MAG: tryptophan synthase subunit alpha [bacterium]|jgi:tryptophan synthase alpha chain|nr:MAG: tryptophan synthase subunit alpha [bacterium]
MGSTSGTTSFEADRLAARFRAWRDSGRRALIPYLTAGHPTLGQTVELMRRIAAAGADIIELGVPFSDPLADGPTIQRASQRAMEQGATLAWCLEALSQFRSGSATPVVLFSYLNPILAYGTDRFIRDAVAAGADGVLITDLPEGADDELEGRFERSDLALIRLIAPTTPPERARWIASRAQGFVYYISRTGVTGARDTLPPGLADEVAALRGAAAVPVAVGFGISTPDQAAAVARVADGVVVGSALIDALDRGGVEAAETFLRGLRAAIDAAGQA